MSAITSEYLFTLEFFGKIDLITPIFAKTKSLLMTQLEDYLTTSYDAICILIQIRVNYQHQLIMNKRRVPCLDPYFDTIRLILWPKFKEILDQNITSIKSVNIKKLLPIDFNCHFITRRYADLSASIHTLNKAPYEDQMLKNDMVRLTKEFEILLLKIAEFFNNDNKSKELFLINNYDQILKVAADFEIEVEDVARFREHLNEQTLMFVEDELLEKFPQIIKFVKDTEPQMARSYSPENLSKITPSNVEEIVKEFAANWKNGLLRLNNSIQQYFQNSNTGMDILKKAFAQLLLYYTRFEEIIAKCWRNPPFRQSMVTKPEVLHEIGNYSKMWREKSANTTAGGATTQTK